MTEIKVGVIGACGRMGSEVVKAVSQAEGMKVTACVDIHHTGENIGEILNLKDIQVTVMNTLETLTAQDIDVIVDFTAPDAVFNNVKKCLEKNIRAVVGTTGLSPAQIEELSHLAGCQNTGVIIAPNFAIGAVLMMMFAKKAAEYMDHAEIIELHHNKKLDAPSGTAVKTAELMESVREKFSQTNVADTELIQGSRGGSRESGIHIHSLRLPGLVAHQEVIFGGQGQTLTIRHDSLDRISFMPGVVLAIRKVMVLNNLVYGLENIL